MRDDMSQKNARIANMLLNGEPHALICRKNALTPEQLKRFILRNASMLVRRRLEQAHNGKVRGSP